MGDFRTKGHGENRVVYPVGDGKEHRIKDDYKSSDNNAFRPIHAKHGYQELKDIGFYAYHSDKNGDWHKNSKIPGIMIIGSYQGYVIFKKQKEAPYGYFPVPDKELGGYDNKIKKGDTETLKRRVLEVKNEE